MFSGRGRLRCGWRWLFGAGEALDHRQLLAQRLVDQPRQQAIEAHEEFFRPAEVDLFTLGGDGV